MLAGAAVSRSMFRRNGELAKKSLTRSGLSGVAEGLVSGGFKISASSASHSDVQRFCNLLCETLRSRRKRRLTIWVGKRLREFEARLRDVRLTSQPIEGGSDSRRLQCTCRNVMIDKSEFDLKGTLSLHRGIPTPRILPLPHPTS